jgi:DNA polymerase I-like protein with 3'-5' exonuclease and polymerase domains
VDLMSQFEELNRARVEKKAWMNEVELILATPDMLDQIAEECIASGIYGLDLETTGLDQRAFPNDQGRLETRDKIVGYCLAPSTTRGYYIPVRHREAGSDANVPPRLVAAMVKRIQEAGARAVFHNAKFDQKFLRCEPAGDTGDWDNPRSWEDTYLLAYLRDSRQKSLGLKRLAKEFLGREMIELDELFLQEKGKRVVKDFSTLDPTWEPVVWYAAADAVNTLALYHALSPDVLEKDKFGASQATIYTVEKLCLISTIWMEQCRIYIDRPKLEELIRAGQREWWDCVEEVYDAVQEVLGRDVRPGWALEMRNFFDPNVISPDYMEMREIARSKSPPDSRQEISKSVPSLADPKVRETVRFPATYDVTIPAELGFLFREMGVPGLVATAGTGQVKTSKDILNEIVESAGDKYPFMKKVKRFREVSKALGSNLFNLYTATTPERSPDSCVWANFKQTGTDTGRFSTPAPSDSTWMGQVSWNVQSTKAPYYDPKDPPPVCVYRQRECIAARPGYTLYAIDFSGVELRIVTNLSGEPRWVQAFFECAGCKHQFERGERPPPFCPKCGSDKIGDLHTLTAISLFPDVSPEADPKAFKAKRQTAKIVNFLLCYGGSGNAVTRSTGCDEEEGWRIKNQFDKSYKGLLGWWRSQEKLVEKQKYVFTSYGRKYPCPDIDHENKFFRSKAKRNAVNGPVQGTSADIMKFAMGLLYRAFKEKGWIQRGPGLPDLVLMNITIHDELVFEIHDSIAEEAVLLIEEIMCQKTIEKLRWTVPLKVDIEFGPNWMVPYNLTAMAHNQGGGEWTERFANMFPTYYKSYLAHGGKPVGEKTLLQSQDPAPSLPPEPAPPPAQGAPSLPPTPEPLPSPQPEERVGKKLVYRIDSRNLTPENARKLARVLQKCSGKGTDELAVQDSLGNDLLGRDIRVAFSEFRLLAQYEGL